jgi:hypothetical protein
VANASGFDVDAILRGYVECALWSTMDESTDESGEGNPTDALDALYGYDDIDAETLAGMRADIVDFLTLVYAGDLVGIDPEQIGHDFWLTRNGHGAGFWDRGLGERGERLTKWAKTYGEVNLYAHDGTVYAN